MTSLEKLFAGGGEMGEKIRDFDWSKSPLGPIENWPQSLKTAVGIILASRQPFWLGWGEQLIKLYNDPYKAIVGGKHPAALGQPAAVVWREIWDKIGPMLEAAMGSGEGTYVEEQRLIMERHGYREETYYTFSYSPIPNNEGGVGGIICANTDETQRVIGERELALLRELAAGTVDARTVEEACTLSTDCLATNPYDLPFAMIYLVEPDGRRVRLTGKCGVGESGQRIAPETVAIDASTLWPFAEALTAGGAHLVPDLSSVEESLPTGAWDRPPYQAVATPIAAQGRSGMAGVLVVGLNPYRLFDDRYRGFLDLVSAQIAAAIANARAYEEERNRAEALDELNRAKTAFFSNVSHEFRTPLTLMLGPLEDLLRKGDPPISFEQREQIETTHRNSLRLLKLVNTLLDFSRIEAGRIRATYEPADLARLTTEFASGFRSAIERAGLRLIIDCPPINEPVYVDREMWEKIVLNLLSNAFKFTFTGEIEVTLRQVGETTELAVRDTGVGIPASELPHIFERFHRVEGSLGRSFEGSGIGLALVQELAGLHGGAARVESQLDHGSVFFVSIPLGKSHLPPDRIGVAQSLGSGKLREETFLEEARQWASNQAEFERLPPQSTVPSSHSPDSIVSGEGGKNAHDSTATGSPTPRILLADDNVDMREYIRRLLGQKYEVVAVGDGDAAFQAALERPPDLVLTDVMMPKLDGFGLLRKLRAEKQFKSTPVIMLSARAGEEAQVDGLAVGADDYLIKPFSARELLARVAVRLESAQLRSQLSEERAYLASIVDSSDDAVVGKTLDSVITSWNKAAERIFGYSAAEAIGQSIRMLIPQDRLVEEDHVLERLRRGERIDHYETVRQRKNGTLFDVSLTISPIKDGNGRIIGASKIARDITDWRRAAKQLEEERETLETINQVGQMLSAQLDLEKLVQALTDAATEITGARFGSFFYNIIDERGASYMLYSLSGVPREHFAHFPMPRATDLFGPTFRGEGVIRIDDVKQDPRYGRNSPYFGMPHGHLPVTSYLAAPVIGRSGKVLGGLFFGHPEAGVFNDRHSRIVMGLAGQAAIAMDNAQLYEASRRARNEAEAANRLKDEFLATVSHELRNPLNIILGWARLLRMGQLDEEGRTRAVGTIEKSAVAQGQIIEDILDVSRIITGKLRLDVSPVEITKVVEEAVESVRPTAEAKGIRLQTVLDTKSDLVAGDANRLQQIAWNLLSNAIKFTPKGGRVLVTLLRVNSHIEISVSDTGQGVSPEFLPHVFERFRQADSSTGRSHGGLGLGLAIVRHLTELHGGSVSVQSAGEGQGAVFTVLLPLAIMRDGKDRLGERPSPRLHRAIEGEMPGAMGLELDGVRVLVVDDEHDARELLQIVLRQCGAQVMAAASAREALEIMKQWKPSVLISDIGMPGEDGYQLIRKVRSLSHREGGSIPAAALTAYARAEDRLKVITSGFQTHIAKPVEPVELAAVVASLAGRTGAAQDKS
jgi:PAS domain S-box-containing protein